MLVDEPELHLNPDLLRIWLAFLRDTILDGQVWFATHSLEAVEIAGPESTFVFERDQGTRLVSNPRILSGRPVLSALSAAIGSPAFSCRSCFLCSLKVTANRGSASAFTPFVACPNEIAFSKAEVARRSFVGSERSRNCGRDRGAAARRSRDRP